MMQPLPEGFIFSQSNLSNWVKCRRLFQYRDIQRRPYPAPETADTLAFEQHMENGTAFHRLVYQYLSGLDAATLSARLMDDTLRGWWEAFLAHGLEDVPAERYAETYLTAPLGSHRLLAKFDLIAVDREAGLIRIMDWKTSLQRPSRATLQRRLQTVVYRYLAVEAGAYYLGWQPVMPEQVEMVYWFTDTPTQPERFSYSATEHAEAREYLLRLAAEASTETEFPKVDEAARETVCRYCVYRTLCWKDVTAGPFAGLFDDETVDEPDDFSDGFDLDLDQVAEVEF